MLQQTLKRNVKTFRHAP